MDTNEKYILSVLFKLKVYKSTKQGYEDLFTDVMTLSNPNYRNPKPQGRLGDSKCDGFDGTTGKYYQIYAPEDLKGNEQTITDKFTKSLKVIIEEWKEISPVKEFYIAVNDKYEGIYNSTEQLPVNLKKTFGIDCSNFTSQDLENLFYALDDDKKFQVLGGVIPNVESLSTVINFEVLKESILYIQNIECSYEVKALPQNIDLPAKIKFNKLNENIAEFINVGSYQIANLDEYFKQNSNNKVILQKVFNNLYNEGLEIISDNEKHRSDIVFFYILEKACVDNRKAVKDAVLTLMSYYFGYCDIFEEPPRTTLF